jgi:xanthine/CO dehydrogenase XdhC/CoxF family maturation factor
MKELRAIVGHLLTAEGITVLATLATVEGSSYRRPGARMLVAEGGARIGSISGGCLEEDLLERSVRVRATGRPQLATYDTTEENDLLWGVGQGCRGVIRVLLEPVSPKPDWARAVAANLRSGRPTRLAVTWDNRVGLLGTALADALPSGSQRQVDGVFDDLVGPPTALAIFGAGDDAQPLARMAIELGWNVTVADPRPLLPTSERFPGAAALVLGPASELVARAAPLPGSLAVVMTHHYLHDRSVARHLLPIPLAFLGLLGPKRRADRMLAEIAAEGLALTPEVMARLHAPVGLDIGAESPEEVALSIIAEMASSLSGRDASPLRNRVLPIHA